MKRVFIIHGWGGNPNEPWLKWLREELEDSNFNVFNPEMPDTNTPTIATWVGKLKEIVGQPNENTYFVGHSIGCQTIMRYLEGLGDNEKVGGAIFVAGWFNLTENTWDDDIYAKEKANEWINIPIDFEKIKEHTKNLVLINSDSDPYVPLSDVELFKDNLGTKVVILKGLGHITGEDNVNELPVVLEELLKMAK